MELSNLKNKAADIHIPSKMLPTGTLTKIDYGVVNVVSTNYTTIINVSGSGYCDRISTVNGNSHRFKITIDGVLYINNKLFADVSAFFKILSGFFYFNSSLKVEVIANDSTGVQQAIASVYTG